MRKRFDRLGASAEKLKKKFPKANFEKIQIERRDAEIITASDAPTATILYLHGGGYFSGSIHAYRRFLLRVAFKCKARVVVVDYRLAPEHPYPAALDDALASIRFVQKKFPGSKIVLGGDSAGGGLALAAILALRDRGEPLPDRAFCVSPWADLVGEGKSMDANDGTDVWFSRRHLEKWGPWYFGGRDPKSPYISPVFGKFNGCCPILLMAGDQEVLLDDSVRIAEKGKQDGCGTTFFIGKNMQHDWLLSLPWLAESKKAFAVLGDFVAKA